MRILAFHPSFNSSRLARGAAAACSLLLLLPLQALSAPLDKNSCAKLALDMQNMKALEIDKLMENGPAWATSHLSAADLSLVRQYIDLDEQLKFRCSAPSSLVHLKHLEEEDEEGGQNSAAQAAESDAKKAQSGDGEEAAPPASETRKAAKAPAKESSHPPRERSGAQ
jgi:hypothetical protein